MACLGASLLSACDPGGGRSSVPDDAGLDAAPTAWSLSFPAGGAGASATLTFFADGRATVDTPAGQRIATPPSGALVMVSLDPGAADQFHDTEATTDGAFVAPGPFTLVAASPGALHVQAPIIGGGTLDLTFSAAAPTATGALGIAATVTGAPVAMIELRLATEIDAAYVGFGEHFDHVDARGTIVPLSFRLGGNAESGTNEHHVPVPTFVSSHGWGLTVASYEAGAADVGASDSTALRMVFEGSSLMASLVAVDDPIAASAQLTQLTGLPKRMPDWALAPMQWRNETTGSAQVIDDVTRTRAAKIPGGCIWTDNPWQSSYNDFTYIPSKFPDPKAMSDALSALGFALVAWSTPYLEAAPASGATDEAQRRWRTAKDAGYLVEDTSGAVWPTPIAPSGAPKGLAVVDLMSDAASAWWSMQAAGAVNVGVSGFKLDYGEDFVPDFLGARLSLTLGGQPFRGQRGRWPLRYHQAYRAAFADDAHRATPSFLIGRGSALGGQAIVDAIWPGDLDCDLGPGTASKVGGAAASIVAMQTLSISGFPVYGADTGGFRCFPTKEQFLRWAEHTAHSIVMQNGGGGDSHLPWAWDDETTTLYRGLARAHMDLAPYLASLLDAASANGTPTIRPLPLSYPKELGAMAGHVDDEYLLGPSILVAPTLTEGAMTRTLYVPSGVWARRSTGELVVGARTITVAAPLGDPAVYLREGSWIPLLAADVDTLGPASDPSVVTAAMRAQALRAHVVLSDAASSGALGFRSGASITGALSSGVTTLRFAPKLVAETLDLTLDVASFTHPLAWSDATGKPIAVVADASSVASCAASCVHVAGTRSTLHLVGASTLTGR